MDLNIDFPCFSKYLWHFTQLQYTDYLVLNWNLFRIIITAEIGIQTKKNKQPTVLQQQVNHFLLFLKTKKLKML